MWWGGVAEEEGVVGGGDLADGEGLGGGAEVGVRLGVGRSGVWMWWEGFELEPGVISDGFNWRWEGFSRWWVGGCDEVEEGGRKFD